MLGVTHGVQDGFKTRVMQMHFGNREREERQEAVACRGDGNTSTPKAAASGLHICTGCGRVMHEVHSMV